MFNGVKLSTVYYDALLVSWAGQDVQDGVEFNTGDSEYFSVDASTARDTHISDHSWDITDGGHCIPFDL
jgi:hypothetical protein